MGLPMGLLPTDVALVLLLGWVLPPPWGSHHQNRATEAGMQAVPRVHCVHDAQDWPP